VAQHHVRHRVAHAPTVARAGAIELGVVELVEQRCQIGRLDRERTGAIVLTI
jgi:hypothetical protein